MPANLLSVSLWYGFLSLTILGGFASLGYEVQQGFDICSRHHDDEAWRIVRCTLHVNGIAMVIANILLIIGCVGMAMADADWRMYGAGTVFTTGCYVSYTQSCERRLREFLSRVCRLNEARPRT